MKVTLRQAAAEAGMMMLWLLGLLVILLVSLWAVVRTLEARSDWGAIAELVVMVFVVLVYGRWSIGRI